MKNSVCIFAYSKFSRDAPKILDMKKTRKNPLKPIAFKLLLLLALIQGALAKYFNIKKSEA